MHYRLIILIVHKPFLWVHCPPPTIINVSISVLVHWIIILRFYSLWRRISCLVRTVRTSGKFSYLPASCLPTSSTTSPWSSWPVWTGSHTSGSGCFQMGASAGWGYWADITRRAERNSFVLD